MMFFSLPPEFGIFMLVVIVGWFAVQGLKSVERLPTASSSSDYGLLEIRLKYDVSSSGKSRVSSAFKDKKTGICTAHVVCPIIGKDEWTTANSLAELEEQVARIHRRNDAEYRVLRRSR